MHKLQRVNEFYEWNHPNDPIKKNCGVLGGRGCGACGIRMAGCDS